MRIETDAKLDTASVIDSVREQTKLRAQIEVVATGSLPNDGKVIEDTRNHTA